MDTQSPPVNPLTQQPLTNADLAQVTRLANNIIALEADIEIREKELEKKAAELNELQMFRLPEAMTEVGLESFRLSNGAEVNVKSFYSCSMTEKDKALKDKGLSWLKHAGLGAVIKRSISIYLPMESQKEIASIRAFLGRKKLEYEDKETVHPSTLKSLMEERLTEGKTFPMDIFKGFAGKKAKVEMPKAK